MTVQPNQDTLLLTCVLLAWLLPLLSFILSSVTSDRYSWTVTLTAPLLLLTSFFGAACTFSIVWNGEPYAIAAPWFHLGDSYFTISVSLNNFSVLMLTLVSFISFLVHVYSIGYMAGDSGIQRYFAMLGFFTFAMQGIVLADNLLLVFVCWELVGFSSYMLIGHWTARPAAAHAAVKAFIMNRIGDAGFLIGLMMIWSYAGTFEVAPLTALPDADVPTWKTAASLLIFCGVIGKSAQFPLMTWLPQAMEGPSPVSALIHAATMVAAGVYLLVKLHFFFTPDALQVVAIIGSLTALMGALSALSQYQFKRILAYSTISQLGLMVTAVGVGSADAAMLHLFTHAFFKACLFLASGSVIYALHQAQHQEHLDFDVQDIRNLGGLRKKMPTTFLAFMIGGSALAGVPFFTGFQSKDAILTATWLWAGDAFSWEWIVLITLLAVSFITVLYTFRLIWYIFLGEEKKSMLVVESPAVMRAPIMILAAGSIWLVVSWNPFGFSGWIPLGVPHHVGISILSVILVLAALATAWFLYRPRPASSTPVFRNSFYLDKVYQLLFTGPIRYVAEKTETFDKKWIDGALHTGAYVQVTLAHVTAWLDKFVIDGFVAGMAWLAREVGSLTRSFQGGKIQLYIFWAIFGIIIFLIWTLK